MRNLVTDILYRLAKQSIEDLDNSIIIIELEVMEVRSKNIKLQG